MDHPSLVDQLPRIQVAAAVFVGLALATGVTAGVTRLRRTALVVGLAGATWVAYGVYEYLVPQGVRYELLLFVPLLVAVTVIGLVAFLVRERKR